LELTLECSAIVSVQMRQAVPTLDGNAQTILLRAPLPIGACLPPRLLVDLDSHVRPAR
jgi:hypothetical protein